MQLVKRIRTVRPRIRRERPWTDDLPEDPRDPDVVRAKALTGARRTGSSQKPCRPEPPVMRP
jgi:hypothetical protein